MNECGLPLDHYADAIELWAPVPAVPPLDADRQGTVVRGLTSALLAEMPPTTARQIKARHGGDERRLLRSLLTLRPPSPLPAAVHAQIDGLLARELESSTITDAESLPLLAERVWPVGKAALWQGDITRLRIDAIVNAANDALLGCFQPTHLCIDNAIHAAAGPRLREDCSRIMTLQAHREPTGCAKATRGYNLPSRFVLHTVGPIIRGPLTEADARALARCYTSCLDVAASLPDVRSIAFCGISTGIFGYPKPAAAAVALDTVGRWLTDHPGRFDLVVFDVFSDDDRLIYEEMLRTRLSPATDRS